MKLILLVLTCVAIALVALACTETATPTNTATPNTAASPPAAPATPIDEFATARVNFAKHCEGCHGPTAEGGLVKVDNKQIRVPSLKRDHALKHTDKELTEKITNGEEEMPAFNDKLTPEEINEMVRFVRKEIQGKG